MSATTVVFYLMLIVHSGDGLSLTKIKEFPNQSSCDKVASTIQTAVGEAKGVEIACISTVSLDALKAANR
jgi:hypothetical protein